MIFLVGGPLLLIGLVALGITLYRLINTPVDTGNKVFRTSRKIKGNFGPFGIDIEREPSKD